VSPERVERKLTAILAADVASYSRLMGADEEGTLARLKAHRRELIDPKITKHRGRLVKTTGDGILIEFSSVVDAVRCAVEVQQGMVERNAKSPEDERIEFRIGINLGDVMVDEHDLYGDGVNIAARLEALADPGGICISQTVLNHARDKVAFEVEDAGEQTLKHIARPVHVYRIVVSSKHRSSTVRPHDSPPGLPDKPSIAVLPFTNMSDAASDVYFADGIAEDIITELSRYPDLFVIARNSSFTYRGQAVRIADVGRELGVQYVVEGSVRRTGNQIRINAQLVDARNSKHLWVQRYDRRLDDIFAVQDEVVQSIVAVLPARIEAAGLERASRKTPVSLEAYDYLLRGKFCHHLENPDANRDAEAHFDRSIELDPRFAQAYAWKACTLGQAWIKDFRPRTPELSQQTSHFVEIAASLDENDTEVHRIMCRLALGQGQFAKSEHHLERALTLNPNDPRLVVQRGINLTFLGESEAAVPWIERAMRIDPFSAHRYYLDLVRALFVAGRSADAITVLDRTRRENYEHYLWRAACHGAMGDIEAARGAGRQAIALRPDLSISDIVSSGFPWKRSEDRIRLEDALTRAGLPR
jgi:adenylate cyclase